MHIKCLLAIGISVLLLGAEVLVAAPAGYIKTFEDHFEGSSLNTNYWTIGLKDAASGHLVPGSAGQYLLNTQYAGYITHEDVSVSNGCVYLQNQKRSYTGTSPSGTFQYTSGWIMSLHKLFINKGYIEYRAKFPSGDKVWPALWLVAEDLSWGPEWDMWEYFGWRSDVGYDNMGMHLCYDTYPTVKWSSAWLKPYNTTYTNSAWHVYGFEWTTTNAVWTIDGVVKRTLANSIGASWPNEAMYFILNNGVKTDSPDTTTTWPNHVVIDYMSIYQFVPLATNAFLSSLVPSAGTLNPSFSSTLYSYSAAVPYATSNMTVTPTAASAGAGATIKVNGNAVASGSPSAALGINIGTNVINTVVVSPNLSVTNTYTLTVTRSALISNVYTVAYSGNGSTGGNVPVDGGNYTNRETVVVLGNTGNLVKTDYKFNGWNTVAGGTGSAYSGGSTFLMGSSNVTLYAQWLTNNSPVVNAGTNQMYMLGSSVFWTPSNLTVAAWFDAADSNTLTRVSNAVSQWNDKSGNGRNATNNTPANRPQYVSGALNGLPAVDFDGANDVLGIGGTGFSTRNAFIVFNAEDAGNVFANWSWPYGSKGTPDIPAFFAWQGNTTVGSQLPTKTSSTASVYFNGLSTGSGTCTLGTLTNVHLLGSIAGSTSPVRTNWLIGSGDAYWNGKIAELIVSSNSISVAERESIEGYLAHKWGLAAKLPVNHTYKGAAPGQATVVATLDGTVSDADGDTLTSTWTLVSGPGAVTFGNANAVDTIATFTVAGTYTLRLTASDTINSTSTDVVITVVQIGFTTIGAVPYVWLATWTNNFEVAVTNDWDSDGFTTVHEYWSGTDPMNSNSFFKIDSMLNNGTNLVLTWQHASIDPANLIPRISIKATSNLLNGVEWKYVDQVQPTNGVNMWTTTNMVNCFYRLSATNTP